MPQSQHYFNINQFLPINHNVNLSTDSALLSGVKVLLVCSCQYQKTSSISFLQPPSISMIPITCKGLNYKNCYQVTCEVQLALRSCLRCRLCLAFRTSYIMSFLSFKDFKGMGVSLDIILKRRDPCMPFKFVFFYFWFNFDLRWVNA